MSQGDVTEVTIPDSERGDFVAFLHYLADIECLGVNGVIYCVEKPWKYADEYQRFLVHSAEEDAL